MVNKSGSGRTQKLLKKLSEASPNDAVKLLFLGQEDMSAVDGLDLSLLSEIKRSPNGTVELKFVDRVAILKALAELQNAEHSENGNAGFYAALDRAAEKLKLERPVGNDGV